MLDYIYIWLEYWCYAYNKAYNNSALIVFCHVGILIVLISDLCPYLTTIIVCREQTTAALIRLRGCTV